MINSGFSDTVMMVRSIKLTITMKTTITESYSTLDGAGRAVDTIIPPWSWHNKR